MDPLTIMLLGKLASSVAGGLAGGSAQAAPAPPPPPAPMPKGNMAPQQPGFDDIFNTRPMGEPAGAGMSFNPGVDPTAQAAATLTASGAQPPVTSPVVSKSATAMPDRGGTPMLPMMGGEMDSYYNDNPDPTQPMTAAGVKTPTQQMLGSLSSGLQDVQVPQQEAMRPIAPPTPPGPTVRPDMSALMQMITQAGQRPDTDPRRGALAAMLMGGGR